jgi:hypothetical protein
MNAHRPIIFISLIGSLILSACGGGASQASSALSVSYTGALPVGGQLAAGTLKLEGTDAAVDAQQANQLLPLWQGLSSLLSSATSSDQEIQGVVAQIESTMSAEQVADISAMQITTSDLTELIQNTTLAPAADGATSAQVQATRRAGSGGGFGPAGGFGPGGGGDGAFIGGGPGGGSAGLPGASSGFPQSTASAGQRDTAAAYQSQYAAAGVNPIMVRAVIQYLLSKAG